MLLRIGSAVAVMLACFVAGPVVQHSAEVRSAASPAVMSKSFPSDAEWATLAEREPLAAIAFSIRRYERDVVRFTATFCKQERIRGALLPKERIRVAFRDEPFAVCMTWLEGGGSAKATVYCRGENDGQMLVLLPIVGVRATDPRGMLPRASARYSIEEFGLVQNTRRTLKAWRASADVGALHTEYLGKRAVQELDGQVCHIIRRDCPTDELDGFVPGEPNPVTAKNHADAFRTVTIYLHAESWLQLGTELRRADGTLAGAYWFRDLAINPPLPATQFTRTGLSK